MSKSNGNSKSKQGGGFGQRLAMVMCTAIVALVVIGAGCYGAYRLALAHVSHGASVAWALVATALLPLATWGGYKLGGTEARGLVAGIGLGAGPVIQTAERVADVKVATAQRMRPAAATVIDAVELPPLPPTRYISSAVEGEVIDV